MMSNQHTVIQLNMPLDHLRGLGRHHPSKVSLFPWCVNWKHSSQECQCQYNMSNNQNRLVLFKEKHYCNSTFSNSIILGSRRLTITHSTIASQFKLRWTDTMIRSSCVYTSVMTHSLLLLTFIDINTVLFVCMKSESSWADALVGTIYILTSMLTNLLTKLAAFIHI